MVPYLWFFKFQIFSILNGEVYVLQNNVYTFLIRAIQRQESNHTVVINLEKDSEDVGREMQKGNSQPQHSKPFPSTTFVWTSKIPFKVPLQTTSNPCSEHLAASPKFYTAAKANSPNWQQKRIQSKSIG